MFGDGAHEALTGKPMAKAVPRKRKIEDQGVWSEAAEVDAATTDDEESPSKRPRVTQSPRIFVYESATSTISRAICEQSKTHIQY